MRKTTLGVLLMLLMMAPLVACGDDSDGGGGSDQSSDLFEADIDASDDTPVDELEESDTEALCAQLEDAGETLEQELGEDGLKRLTCTAFAVLLGGGGNEAACEAAVEECMASEEGFEPDEEEEFECSEVEDCSATVAEMEACINDSINATRALVNGLTCANALERLQGAEEAPASCQAIEDKCPGILEDDEGGDGGDDGGSFGPDRCADNPGPD